MSNYAHRGGASGTSGISSVLSILALIIAPSAGAEPAGEPGRGSSGPNPLHDVYFGEQHLHTANSPDAFSFGTRNMPDDSYRYCKGEAVKKSTGGADNMVKRITPYDWCAVTDHAVFFGMLPLMLDKNNPLSKTEIGKLISAGAGKYLDADAGTETQTKQK